MRKDCDCDCASRVDPGSRGESSGLCEHLAHMIMFYVLPKLWFMRICDHAAY